MDYTTLVGAKTVPNSLADRVNYAPLVPVAPELIKNAQDEIFARLRVREMRYGLTIPLALGDSTAPLPVGFLDLASLFDQWNSPVRRVSEDKLIRNRYYDSTGALTKGQPSRVAIFDEAFQFDFAAYQACTLRGLYFKPTYISDQLEESFLTRRYSQLFWAVLLKHGYAYYQDMTSAGTYEAAAQGYFAQIEQSSDLDYRGLSDDDNYED